MKSDLELVLDAKAGHRMAFSELVRRHQRGLLRLVLRFMKDLDLAEDVVQDSFVKAYQKLHMFEGKSAFKSRLYRIAINTAKNKLRQNTQDTVQLDLVQISTASSVEREMNQVDLQEVMKVEIAKLPEKQRTSLILRVYEDLSFKEIAQIMDCPYDTAKANYRHAVMKLKDALQELNVQTPFAEGDQEGKVFWNETQSTKLD